MKKILFSAFMLSVLASCSKSDDNSESQDSGIYLRIKFNSTELNTTFQYND